MIIKQMRWDQKQTFNKCLINNNDGTYSLSTSSTVGGTPVKVEGRRDVMDLFNRCIVNNKVQITT